MRRSSPRISRRVHEISSFSCGCWSPDGQGQPRQSRFQKQLEGKDLVFQLHTLDGKVARHYLVRDLRVSSKRGTHPQPAFFPGVQGRSLRFRRDDFEEPAVGLHAGHPEQGHQIQGNPALVIWFQGLVEVPQAEEEGSGKKAA